MISKNLVICPVHNEQETIEKFFQNLRNFYFQDVAFIDDGSTDHGKDRLLAMRDKETFLIKHPERRGYGAALLSGFKFALKKGYKKVITIDVDLQHNPEHIPQFLDELEIQEAVLGSRYLSYEIYGPVPPERLAINRYVSGLIDRLFSVRFTDPFCGYRGYRDTFLKRAELKQAGYGLGLEIVLEIIRTGTSFSEIPIKAIYNNHLRKFMDGLNDSRTRLLYYLNILASKKEQLLRI